MESVKYRLLVQCIRQGNMTRAAQSLGYTQSAASRMIADLEEKWGVPLLIRSKKGVQPTREARSLLPQLEAIVESENQIRSTLEAMTDAKELNVGVFASISVRIVPELLQIFGRQNPGTKVRLRTGEYDEIERWLQNGTVDCGFLPEPVRKTLEAVPVVSDQLVAVLPMDHPCVHMPVFPTERLSREVVISLKEYEDDEMENFWHSLGFPPAIAYEANDDYTILSMIEHGLGMGILHDLVADTRRFQVVRRPLDVSQVRQLSLAYPGPGNSAAAAFLRSIRLWKNLQAKP